MIQYLLSMARARAYAVFIDGEDKKLRQSIRAFTSKMPNRALGHVSFIVTQDVVIT